MAVATISTTSCSKSDDINDIDPVQAAINILPTLNNATETRSDAAYMPVGGVIELLYDAVDGNTQSAKFKSDGDDWSEDGTPLYWDDLTANAANYKFYAFAPAKPAAAPAVLADQKSQLNNTASDLLVAYSSTATKTTLPLAFKHVLSQIKVSVTTNAEGTSGHLSLMDTKLSIKGAYRGYTLDYSSAAATTPAVATVAVTPALDEIQPFIGNRTNTSAAFQTILPAQNFAVKTLVLTFTIKDRIYTWKNSSAIDNLTAGQSLNIALKVTQTGITLKAGGITLTPWNDLPLDGGNIDIDE